MIKGINIIFHSVKKAGGMESVVLDLLDGFLEKNIKVRMIARTVQIDKNIYPNTEFVELKDKTILQRLNDYLFNCKAMNYVNKEWPTLSFSLVKGSVDIAGSGGNHKGYLIGKNKKIKTINDYIVLKTETDLYKNSKKIVVHSDLLCKEVIEYYGIEKEKVEIVYPPIDSNKFSLKARENREEIREKLGFPKDKLVLLFPSNDHKRKGGELILSAIKKFNGKILLAVASRKKLLGDNVINIGFCKNMPEVYAAADCAILASNYEPFGLVGPEAVLCGTPVILSENIGCIPTIDEEACFTFDRNVESLEKVLEKVLEKFENNQLSLEDNNKKYLKYEVTIAHHIDKLLEILSAK